jgi:hypothetical protein
VAEQRDEDPPARHRECASAADLTLAVDVDVDASGGESACWAHLVCPGCGAPASDAHRPGCPAAHERVE